MPGERERGFHGGLAAGIGGGWQAWIATDWTERRWQFARMEETDDACAAAMAAIKLPIERADWVVEPPSDPTPEEQDAAEILGRGLLGGLRDELTASGDTVTEWRWTVSAMLQALTFGHAVLEQTWESRSGYLLPSRLSPRDVTTLSFLFDDRGRVRGVRQMVVGQEVEIPAEALVISTIGPASAGVRGVSLLSGARRVWILRELLMRIHGIAHERWGGGMPTAFAPAGVARGDEEWKAAEKVLQEIRTNETSWSVWPDGWEVRALDGPRGRRLDALPSIEVTGDLIFRSVLANHLTIRGSAQTRGPLAVSFTNTFLQAVRGHADAAVAAPINGRVLRPLTLLNFGPEVRPPRLRARNIGDSYLAAIAFLAQSGVLQQGPELDRWARELSDIPIESGGRSEQEGDE